MKIHEYQGKELLKKFGVAVPRGIACFSVDEAIKAAESLGGKVWVVTTCAPAASASATAVSTMDRSVIGVATRKRCRTQSPTEGPMMDGSAPEATSSVEV